MKRLLPLLLAATMLTGCGEDEKHLEGDRLSVMTFDSALKVDEQLAAMPMVLPDALSNSNWPTSGGRIDHGGGNYALNTTLKRAWREDVGDGIDAEQPLMASPVAGGGLVYTMDSGARVSALSMDKGKLVWKSDLTAKGEKGDATGGGVSLANGVLYAATGYGEVIALKAEDGTELWRQKLASPLRSAPTAADGRVYVVSIDNTLIALDANNGAKLWSHQGILEAAGLLGAASPAVGAGIVLAAFSSGEIYALLGETGRPLWSDNLAPFKRTSSIASIAAIRGLPVITPDGSLVLAVSNADRLVAIDIRSGQRVWEQKIGGAQMPWVAGDNVFIISNQAQLVALNLRDGAVRWTSQLKQYDKPEERSGAVTWAGPVLAGGKLWLVNSKGQLRSYDPGNGADLTKDDLGHGAIRAPIAAGGTLFVLDDSADLSAWR